MTRTRGMTIAEFNNILNDMRKIYKFDDEETRLSDMIDPVSNSLTSVEIIMLDKETGVTITMCKGAERG